MLKNRRLWLMVPILLAVVLLGLARSRGTAPPVVPPPSDAARNVAVSTPDASTPAPVDGEDQPRHPRIGFRSSDLLLEHFRKHGNEFHVKSPDAYLRLAQLLRERPKGPDVLEIVRNDAVTCKFDRETGAFIAYNSDGTIRTFFRPTDGEAYFERQKHRAHESP